MITILSSQKGGMPILMQNSVTEQQLCLFTKYVHILVRTFEKFRIQR